MEPASRCEAAANGGVTVPRNHAEGATFQLGISGILQTSKKANGRLQSRTGIGQMGADIINLADVRKRKAALQDTPHAPAAIPGAPDLADRFHFWTGATGRRYVHTVYSLLECPALPMGNYILVNRDTDGHRSVLSVGSVSHEAASLNLAEIRHRGAELGANEVHIHLLAATPRLSKLVEFDLRGRLAPEAAAQGQH
jgi:hypothetical protein